MPPPVLPVSIIEDRSKAINEASARFATVRGIIRQACAADPSFSESMKIVDGQGDSLSHFLADAMLHAASVNESRLAGAPDSRLPAGHALSEYPMYRAGVAAASAGRELGRIASAASDRQRRFETQRSANLHALFILACFAILCTFCAMGLGWRSLRALRNSKERERWLRTLVEVTPGPDSDRHLPGPHDRARLRSPLPLGDGGPSSAGLGSGPDPRILEHRSLCGARRVLLGGFAV